MIILTLICNVPARVHVERVIVDRKMNFRYDVRIECEKCAVSVIAVSSPSRDYAIRQAFVSWNIMNSEGYKHDCTDHLTKGVPFDPPYTLFVTRN